MEGGGPRDLNRSRRLIRFGQACDAVNQHPFLDHARPIGFAHRGGDSVAPENTMAAFQDAVDLGYTHVETDVHATLDGILLAFHDDDLARTCGDNRTIAGSTWSDLTSVKVAGTEPIPRLEEILGTWSDIFVNIDCKADTAVEPLIEFFRTRRHLLERVCIGSFSDARLDAIRTALGADLLSSMGPRAVARLVGRARKLPVPLRSDGARCVQVPPRQGAIRVVTPRFVETAHDHGLHVHVWTIDDREKISELLDMGVDGIMSDDTRTLRSVLDERGHWPPTKRGPTT